MIEPSFVDQVRSLLSCILRIIAGVESSTAVDEVIFASWITCPNLQNSQHPILGNLLYSISLRASPLIDVSGVTLGEVVE